MTWKLATHCKTGQRYWCRENFQMYSFEIRTPYNVFGETDLLPPERSPHSGTFPADTFALLYEISERPDE